ncbi:hypothetical protein BKM69_14095, partial [Listeria monocytogenes]
MEKYASNTRKIVISSLLKKGTGGLFSGATPERLLAVNGDEIHSSCVAGSTERGATEEADEALGNALLKDAKNLREIESSSE